MKSNQYYYFTTELVCDIPISRLLKDQGVKPGIIELMRYFTTGRFVYDPSSQS